jgi:uncharacterized Zn finger protein (UPF0148 family)
MKELACPKCRAAINSELVDDTGSVECPFCGHEWSLLEVPEAGSDFVEGEPVTGVVRTISGITSQIQLPGLPAGSQIKVVEATEDRLVLYIPGGGKSANALAFFAALWNGFMLLFTGIALGGALHGKGIDAPPLLGLVAFLGLFWAVGLGLAFYWMKLKYERTFLLVDRDRLVVKRVLFKRNRVDETALASDSRAALVESYQQNDCPVYRVEVQGPGGKAKFGTSLADAEKDWLVDRINDFLGRTGAWALEAPATSEERAAAIASLPASCQHCGAPLSGELVKGALTCTHCGGVFRATVTRPAGAIPVAPREHLVPAELPPGSPLLIDEDLSDVLELHYLLAGTSPARWLVPIVMLPFGLIWYSMVFGMVGGAWQAPFLPVRIVAIVISIPFLLVGLLPFVIGLFMLRGRTTVRLTPEVLECRWNAGFFHYARSLPTDQIDVIKVQVMVSSRGNPRVKVAKNRQGPDWKTCVARAGGKSLYLSLGLDQTVSGQLAALLRTRLEDMGHVLVDA